MENQELIQIIIIMLAAIVIVIMAIQQSRSVIKTNFSPFNKFKKASVPYYLPESLVKISATAKVRIARDQSGSLVEGETRIAEMNFVISSEIQADTRDMLALNYHPEYLSSDKINLTVNTKGLLESVSTETEDRLPDIISGIPKGFLSILSDQQETAAKPALLITTEEYTSEFMFRPFEINEDREVPWEITIKNEKPQKDLPIDTGYTFNLKNNPEGKTINHTTKPSLDSLLDVYKEKKVDGILTRPLKGIYVTIKPKGPEFENNSTGPVYHSIADTSRIIIIPFKRAAFVKQTNNVTFNDGLVLSNDINKPSSMEGFLSIPIDIAKTIFSIPSQLIQFKIDTTKKSAELEKTKLQLEKEILQLKKEIEKIKDPG